MDNLTVIDNELVPVYLTDSGTKIVDGRELHAVLQSKQDFSTWVKRRLNECDAKENKDYELNHNFVEQVSGTKHRIDYTILLDTAKEMAMLERNAKGKQVRRYFIKVDEKYKEEKSAPLTLQQQIQTIAKGTDELYQRVDVVEERIKGLEDTMNIDHGQQRKLANAVNRTVITVLGGKESNAYKAIGRKVFCECNGNLKDYFNVNSRDDVPRKRYEEALKYAEKWKPCMNTQMLIEQYNAQQSLHLEGGAYHG